MATTLHPAGSAVKTAHQPLFSALRLLSGIQSRAILCTSVLPFACCIRVAPDLLAKELEFALFAGALISHSSKTGPVLQVVPDSPGILISKGLAEQETGDWNAALCHFQQATHLDPQNAIAFRLMGDALARLGSWADARASYDLSIVLDPACADAYNNLGIALLELGLPHNAIAAHAKAAEIDPNHANAHFNLGRLCALFNQIPAAKAMFDRALAIDPNHPYVHLELGTLFEKCGLLEQAADHYRRSLELDPTRTVRQNLAAVLALLGDPTGIALQEDLVREQPDDPEAHWNLGISLLLHRDYAYGWREFEWRTGIPRFRKLHSFQMPRWGGEPLQGKTILLYGEQGHGDTLQFLRYLPLVAARGGHIVLQVPPLLVTLLEHFPHVDRCVGPTDPMPHLDTYASLMSLPHLLQPYPIPPPIAPTLDPHPPLAATPGEALRVGLAWAGSPKQQRDSLRSIPLAQWNRLAGIQGLAFTALQMGPRNPNADDAGHAFHFERNCIGLQNFSQLADVIDGLDLVITVDTAVAHLAGSLGKPVWILLPLAVDWRWGLSGASSDWYPTARLFRQNTSLGWHQVISEVALELDRIAPRTFEFE